MSDNTRDFNSEARFWDNNPGRIKMAGDVAEAIKQNVKISGDLNVLDFGCGTGLLTLNLQPLVKTITGADSSQGMLDMLASKIEQLGLQNVKIVYLENGSTERLNGSYDLVVSSMTMHHVNDIQPLLHKFSTIVKKDGYLCIADLDPEGGLFHEDNTGVFHFGFNRESLRQEFEIAGFSDIKDVTAAEVTKPTANGEMKNFTVFLVYGRKQ